jgi:hypothetical protein
VNEATDEAKFQGTKMRARGTRFVQSDPWRSSSADAWRGRLIVVSFIIEEGHLREGNGVLAVELLFQLLKG